MEDRGAVRLVDALDGAAGVNNTLGEGSRDHLWIRVLIFAKWHVMMACVTMERCSRIAA